MSRLTIQTQQNLENSILKGLVYEWKKIYSNLPEAYKKTIRQPVFSLSDGQIFGGRVATWQSKTYRICFKRNFILAARWSNVLDVLRHEMAHQLADTFYGNNQETSHGQCFKRACSILQADPSASAAIVPRSQRIIDDTLHAPEQKEDRLIVRVQKLMSLAKSSNQIEAEAAAAKANELITKYNLEILAADTDRDFCSLLLCQPALRHPGWYLWITGVLNEFYFVNIIWVGAFCVDRSKPGRSPEVSGTAQNVQIAHYVFDFINKYIDTQWETYRKNHDVSWRDKTSFAKGVVRGFREKLTVQKNKTIENFKHACETSALVRTDDPKLSVYIKERYKRLRSFGGPSSIQPQHFNEGKKAGQNLVISKAVCHHAGNTGLQIGQ